MHTSAAQLTGNLVSSVCLLQPKIPEMDSLSFPAVQLTHHKPLHKFFWHEYSHSHMKLVQQPVSNPILSYNENSKTPLLIQLVEKSLDKKYNFNKQEDSVIHFNPCDTYHCNFPPDSGNKLKIESSEKNCNKLVLFEPTSVILFTDEKGAKRIINIFNHSSLNLAYEFKATNKER